MLERLFRRRRATLAVCTACGADFVHPVEWHPHGQEHWWMHLRCGACGASRDATVPDADADLFEAELDRALECIRLGAERLSHERLAEQAAAFGMALELDLIGADDFSQPD